MLRLIFALISIHLAFCEQVRQCTCSEIEPCKTEYMNTLIPCADECKSHVIEIGANYEKLKECILSRRDKAEEAMVCVKKTLASACAKDVGETVEKRYPETLKIAALVELDRMLKASGVQKDVKELVVKGRKMFHCLKECTAKSTDKCINRDCGLKLPPDSELIKIAKRCAGEAGFNVEEVKAVCNCVANAGVKQLQGGLCERLVLT